MKSPIDWPNPSEICHKVSGAYLRGGDPLLILCSVGIWCDARKGSGYSE